VLSIISKRLVRKALDMFADIAKDEEKFATFSKNFGRYIKVGLIEDKDNKEKLLKLATFSTTFGEEATTLPKYKERMKEGQKKIYYMSAASTAAAAASPVLEGLKKKGYEVLVAVDQIDEIALQGVGTFDDLEVVDAGKESTDEELTDDEKAASEAAKADLKSTCDFVKSTLGSLVDKVDVSSRLTTSPSALVQPQWGMSPQMQRFMKAQAAASGGEDMMMGGMAANLELNAEHPVVGKLKGMVAADDAASAEYATLLYEVAAVSSGYEVKDPAAFAQRVVKLMAGEELAVDDDVDEEVIEFPEGDAEPSKPEPIVPEVIEEQTKE